MFSQASPADSGSDTPSASGHRVTPDAPRDAAQPYARRVPDHHEVPQELLKLPRWICWQLVPQPGKKPKKQPISPKTGRMEHNWQNDPDLWGTFEEARDYCEAHHHLHGLSIVLGDGLAGIDLDNCRNPETGELSQDAQFIVSQANSYSEISPSLKGIRVLAFGGFNGFGGSDQQRGIEFYDDRRHLTFTGDHLESSPFSVERRDWSALGQRYFPKRTQTPQEKGEIPQFWRVGISGLKLSAHTRHIIASGDASSYAGDRSKALFGVAKDLLKAGLSPEDTARVLADPSNRISDKAAQERGGDLAGMLEWTLKYNVLPASAEVAKEAKSTGPTGGGDTGPLLRHVSLENFTALRPKAPEFVIGPFIPRGFVTLLGGHGEIGKSMLALTLAAHVAVGRDWADLPITQGKVRYISLEDDGELVLYRLQRIAEAYSLDTDAMSANLSIIDASDAGPLAQEVNVFGAKGLTMTPLAAEVEALAAGYDLVILDNASDAFDGDENSRRQVRTFIKSLAKWVKGHRGAVLLLAHIDKAAARFGANGNSYSGSTAWHNSARSRLALARNPKTDAIELAHEKLNVGRKLEDPIILDWNEGGVLLPISANVRQSIEALAEVSFDQDVYALVRAAIAAEMTVTTATTGPVTAWHTLQPLPEFPAQLKPRSAKPRFEAALIRLSRKGMIRREKYTKDYKARERWVL